MDQIANAMGISKKTIYNFFQNKTELVKSVANYMLKSISERKRVKGYRLALNQWT